MQATKLQLMGLILHMRTCSDAISRSN